MATHTKADRNQYFATLRCQRDMQRHDSPCCLPRSSFWGTLGSADGKCHVHAHAALLGKLGLLFIALERSLQKIYLNSRAQGRAGMQGKLPTNNNNKALPKKELLFPHFLGWTPATLNDTQVWICREIWTKELLRSPRTEQPWSEAAWPWLGQLKRRLSHGRLNRSRSSGSALPEELSPRNEPLLQPDLGTRTSLKVLLTGRKLKVFFHS